MDIYSKENTEILLENVLFPADYDFEKVFVVQASPPAEASDALEAQRRPSLFSDRMKILRRIRIENCQFHSHLQFSGFLNTIKDQMDLMDGFKDGLLDTLVIKNLKLPGAQMNSNCNLELRVLKALSNPAKNAQIYSSIRHLELSINNCTEDLNANPDFFFEHYSEIFDFFSKVGLNKDTYI